MGAALRCPAEERRRRFGRGSGVPRIYGGCAIVPVMQDVAGKVAVITGGASGIGFGMATRFAQAGMRVVLADIEEPVLEQAVARLQQDGAQVIGVPTDVSNAESVELLAARTLESFGGVHILCNNAGI